MIYKFNPYRNDITGERSLNPAYKEILRLEQMLIEAGIPHTCERNHDGWQVCYPVNEVSPERIISVIEHYGSYGKDDDKLEIMGLLTPDEAEWDSVLGYLTAEDVFERIRKHWAGEWDDYIASLPSVTDSESEEDYDETLSNVPMTPEEFAAEMCRLRNQCDTGDICTIEDMQINMINVMRDLLQQLGYNDGIDIFDNAPKTYW